MEGLAQGGFGQPGEPLLGARAPGLGPGEGLGGGLVEEELERLGLALELDGPGEDAHGVVARVAPRLAVGQEAAHLAGGGLEY